MNTSGEAADQVVRMSLEVGEAALKITGAGAKQLAVILYAVLKEQKKTKGRARLETLVRSGKPLTVYSVKESDLKQFVTEAKRYGILYCAVRNPKGSIDGMVDVVVKEEDAPRINRMDQPDRGAVQVCFCYRSGSDQDRDRKEQRGKIPQEEPGGVLWESGAGYRKGKAEGGTTIGSERNIRKSTGSPTAGASGKITGGPAHGRTIWGAGKERGETTKPLFGKDREIPSVRAYLREARQNRRGYF